MTRREELVEAAICLRERELCDLDLLLDDDRSTADLARSANRDPLAWVMRIAELQRLVHLGRCMPLLAVVAGIVPPELEQELAAEAAKRSL